MVHRILDSTLREWSNTLQNALEWKDNPDQVARLVGKVTDEINDIFAAALRRLRL
jgi:hypothetical protein